MLLNNKANPYPFYAMLRAEAAAHRISVDGLGEGWLVTRYDDALTVFKDERFKKSSTSLEPTPPARPGDRVSRFGPDMLGSDPPDHTRLRALVSTAFTSRRVDSLQGRVQQLAEQLLDRVEGRGQMDLIADYAAVIPTTILCEMLGIPVEDVEWFRAFAYALSLGHSRTSDSLEAEKVRFAGQLRRVAADRRAQPRDDLITALVNAEQADRLSAGELLGMTYLLVIAGYMTTTNLLGNGMLALLRSPDQLDLIRRNPDLIPSAVEELLRFDGPLELTSAVFAATDIELGGTLIPRGERVRVILPSVNRDQKQFADPDTLDITRDARRHLAFGQGIHLCLGAPLARLEAQIMLRVLLDRLPYIELAVRPEQLEWLAHPNLRGLTRLPIRFSVGPRRRQLEERSLELIDRDWRIATTDAVGRALTFLTVGQRPSGEFAVLRGRRRDLADGVELKSVFGTALVARVLTRFPTNDRALQTLERAREFLRSEREPNGRWRYFGRGSSIPEDADDTACAMQALSPGREDHFTINDILRNRHESGAVWTWFLEDSDSPYRNVVDAVVNAHVYALLHRRSIPDPAIRAYLEGVLADRSFSAGTPYYPSPLFFLYAIAGVADALPPATTERIRCAIIEQLPRALDGAVLDAALSCAALAACGSTDQASGTALMQRILAEQQEDGGWPAEGVYGDQSPHLQHLQKPLENSWYGSRELVTALCLQAIAPGLS